MSTRGAKSSELKTAYHSAIVGTLLLAFGIWMDADLIPLATAIGIVLSPLSVFYPMARTVVKAANGESEINDIEK